MTIALRSRAEWLEPTFRITPGDDPLALQTVTTDRIIPGLLPGVLANTQRARYLSFFAWLLRRFAQQRRTPTNEALSAFVKRHEYELAVAALLCPRECGASPLGTREVRPVVRRDPATYARDESVKSFLGGYGLYYRTPMRSLGLVAPAGTPLGDSVTSVDVLRPDNPAAIELADLFDSAVNRTTYARTYVDSTKAIPKDVLVEFASRACLCRLDEFPDERDALRRALLAPGPERDPRDVKSRRAGFGLFLRVLADAPDAGESDRRFRRGVWAAFTRGTKGNAGLQATLARWAALAATHAMYDGIFLLWEAVGPDLRNQDVGDGLSRDDARTRTRVLAEAGTLKLPSRTFRARSSRRTSELLEAVRGPRAQLSDFDSWARDERTPIAALALMLATYARLPQATTVDSGWIDVGRVNGEHQPGLMRMAQMLEGHLADRPTLGESLWWAVRTFVLRPHEDVAQMKLPEFTFRFRTEAGRLRFYPLRFDMPGLGDIRSQALSILSEDLGYCRRTNSGQRVTPAGTALVAEIFGS